MIYRFLADFVLIFHLLFIVFVILGGLLAFRCRWLVLIHIPAALWGAYIELAGGLCPLTTMEVRLRRIAGDTGYSGSFIEHYLLPIIYPAGLSRDIQFGMAGLVILINVAIYSALAYWLRKIAASRR